MSTDLYSITTFNPNPNSVGGIKLVLFNSIHGRQIHRVSYVVICCLFVCLSVTNRIFSFMNANRESKRNDNQPVNKLYRDCM